MICKKIVALAAATVIGLVSLPASAKISAETGLKHSKSAKVTSMSHKHSKHHRHHRRTAKKTVASSKLHKSASHKIA